MSTVLPSKCINVGYRHDSKCVLSIIITISDHTSWFASAFSFALPQSNFLLVAIPPVLNNGPNLYNGKSLPVLMATTVEAVQKIRKYLFGVSPKF